MFYDRHGIPITGEEWARLREHDPEYRRIARTAIMSPDDLGHLTHVSTVWLGIDHRVHETDGPLPVIFETLIAGPDGSDVVERYGTTADAEAGHHRHVVETAADTADAIVTDLDPAG